MSSERRKRQLDPIEDALLHGCEEYIRGYEQRASNDRMAQLADSIQQMFKQRVQSGDDTLPWPDGILIPTKQLVDYDQIYASQFLTWIAALHKELNQRTVSRYAA
jgi:hypothetical protein